MFQRYYWPSKCQELHIQQAFVMKTNSMHYLSLIYFVNQPLLVLGIPTAHHQEVFTVFVQKLVPVIRLGRLASGQQPVTKMYNMYQLLYKYNEHLMMGSGYARNK
jgi:hypothetical protein